jgi:hypothetical protein
VIPDGIVTSVWPRVEHRLATVGVEFDPWQQGLASAALGCRADGLYAATIGGVVASIPRQVGKTFTVGNLLIGLAAEFPGLKVVWTSHHNRTTTNTFRSMQGMVTRKKMRGLLAPNGIRVANGEQEIRFANGSIIMFGAREQGFGRGIDAIDIEVFDEAQILSLKALEDMVPATNQSRHPHGALIFFIGTPPRPTDNGEAFGYKRAEAIDGTSTDQLYVELSADYDAKLDDHAQWRKANPSFPHRTPLASMLRMRKNMPDDDSWRREALGIWPVTAAEPWKVWPREVWDAAASHEDDLGARGWLTGAPSLAVEVAHDRSAASLVAVGDCREGGIGIELVARGEGIGWVVNAVRQIDDGDLPIAHVVIDPKSPALTLIEPLREAGVTVYEPSFDELRISTGHLYDAVGSGQARHRKRPDLTEAVAHAAMRTSGDAWLFDRRTGMDTTAIIGAAVALAGYLAGQTQPEKSGARDYLLVL